MLKIGIMLSQNGRYEGKSIVSAEYLRSALSPSPQNSNYGFMFWLGKDWYGCRGCGGQSITVFPEKDRIVVTQATPTDRPLEYNDLIFGEYNNVSPIG